MFSKRLEHIYMKCAESIRKKHCSKCPIMNLSSNKIIEATKNMLQIKYNYEIQLSKLRIEAIQNTRSYLTNENKTNNLVSTTLPRYLNRITA